MVEKLSAHPVLASFVVTEQLVRKAVVVVANVAEGLSPARLFPHLRPEERFEVASHSGRLVIDAESYYRYNTYVDLLVSLDSAGLVETYRNVRPLIDEAYQELGYGERPFEDVLTMAFTVVLKTPIVRGDMAVKTVSVNYTYSAQWIEDLPPVQRQLLRWDRTTSSGSRRSYGRSRSSSVFVCPPRAEPAPGRCLLTEYLEPAISFNQDSGGQPVRL